MVDNLYDIAQKDKQLKLGMKVAVRWLENGFSYSGMGEVTRLEKFSVTVCVQPQGGKPGSTLKKMLKMPRFADQTRWSRRRCVMPA